MIKNNKLSHHSAETPNLSHTQEQDQQKEGIPSYTKNNPNSIVAKILPAILAITPAIATNTNIASAQQEETAQTQAREKDNNAFQVSPVWSRPGVKPNGASIQYEHSWNITNNFTFDWSPAEVGGVKNDAEQKPEDLKFKLWASTLFGTSYSPTEKISLQFKTGPRVYLYGYYPKDADTSSNVYLESSWGMGFQLGVRYKLPHGLFIGLAYTPDWPAGGEPEEIKPGLSLDIDKGMTKYQQTGDLYTIGLNDIINYDEIGHVGFQNGKWHHAMAISFGGTF